MMAVGPNLLVERRPTVIPLPGARKIVLMTGAAVHTRTPLDDR